MYLLNKFSKGKNIFYLPNTYYSLALFIPLCRFRCLFGVIFLLFKELPLTFLIVQASWKRMLLFLWKKNNLFFIFLRIFAGYQILNRFSFITAKMCLADENFEVALFSILLYVISLLFPPLKVLKIIVFITGFQEVN